MRDHNRLEFVLHIIQYIASLKYLVCSCRCTLVVPPVENAYKLSCGTSPY